MHDYREDFFSDDLYDAQFQYHVYPGETRGIRTHCALCWGTIDVIDCRDYKAGGYYCVKTGRWLCSKCFWAFRKKFRWKLL